MSYIVNVQILAHQLTREKLVQGRYQMLVQAEKEKEEEEGKYSYYEGGQCVLLLSL